MPKYFLIPARLCNAWFYYSFRIKLEVSHRAPISSQRFKFLNANQDFSRTWTPWTRSATVTGCTPWMLQKLHHQEEQLSQMKPEIVGMPDKLESLFAVVREQTIQSTTEVQNLSPSSISAPFASAAPCAPLMPSSNHRLQLSPVSSASAISPHLTRREKFSGDFGDCCDFLTQCKLHFELQSSTYPTEQSKTLRRSLRSLVCSSLQFSPRHYPRYINSLHLVEEQHRL